MAADFALEALQQGRLLAADVRASAPVHVALEWVLGAQAGAAEHAVCVRLFDGFGDAVVR